MPMTITEFQNSIQTLFTTFQEKEVQEQDPPVYYSIVILTILYYLRVADLMGITSPYPRENIIAGNYILADTQAFLSKRHRQQNKEILIKHSPGIGECFLFLNIQLTKK